jgi:hypothetical protein
LRFQWKPGHNLAEINRRRLRGGEIMRHWDLLGLLSAPKGLGSLSALTARSAVQKRVADCTLETDPYPYFVADNVLPAAVLQAVHDHWPGRDQFKREIPHNYVCDLLRNRIADGAQRKFWREFVESYGNEIAAAAAIQFRPWIAARYGSDIDVQFAMVSLMESDPEYQGHGCHTHHYHDPGWIGSLLLYLDRDATGFPGTTIQHFGDADLQAQARMAAATLQWYAAPGMSEMKTVPYAENRLFAFLDSPISYHSVHAAEANAVGNRRIFRIHLTAPSSAIKKAYGVSRRRYQSKRRLPTEDREVVGWLARDIEQQNEQSRQYRATASHHRP